MPTADVIMLILYYDAVNRRIEWIQEYILMINEKEKVIDNEIEAAIRMYVFFDHTIHFYFGRVSEHEGK
ncbi:MULTISPECIES: hypothetical protein [Paenibacillus]|uniref:Uncharacterized protein n=1 Tax=Paenibacillus taichungensis TaxID=484184 RepID=A0A329QJ43_9BACL|nr:MULTISPECIES: hypothetical protein [Paenibacillus]NEU65118.1 hypothetical protein [Paenibacillus sp. ALJ109b]RAW12276.1 hypothetical protein DC345_23490 [Paenibacillus taichungensis]